MARDVMHFLVKTDGAVILSSCSVDFSCIHSYYSVPGASVTEECGTHLSAKT